MMGVIRDHTTPYKNLKTCHECGKRFRTGQEKVTLDIYDDPWAMNPCIVRVHTENDNGHGSCLDKMTDTSWADFRYFECQKCERLIVRQCLDNGWRSYVKTLDEEEVCVRCYQEMVLEDGENAEEFEKGHIPGDFYNSADISAHDWALVPGFHGAFINGKGSVIRFCNQALKLIADGHKVLVNLDSMGIGGSEGYVSLYVKA